VQAIVDVTKSQFYPSLCVITAVNTYCSKYEQESRAIAKKTARCALYK